MIYFEIPSQHLSLSGIEENLVFQDKDISVSEYCINIWNYTATICDNFEL
jgi:hypothetical protein